MVLDISNSLRALYPHSPDGETRSSQLFGLMTWILSQFCLKSHSVITEPLSMLKFHDHSFNYSSILLLTNVIWRKMADARLVLNDALCFCVGLNKFGRITLKSLKSALSDFYDVSVLSDAKIQVLTLLPQKSSVKSLCTALIT